MPFIIHRVSEPRLNDTQTKVLEAAKQLKLSTHSLAPLAVLSCLYEQVGGPDFLPVRKLLKPSASYTQQDAYNALFDLRSIELFLSNLAFKREPFAFCACDRAIAAFSCGLNGQDSRWENERPSFTVSVTEELSHAWMREVGTNWHLCWQRTNNFIVSPVST